MLTQRKFIKKIVLSTISLSLFLSGCAVGPNFHSPAAPKVKSYNAHQDPKKTVSTPGVGEAGNSQYFVSSNNISAMWWQVFCSPELNSLIDRGIKNSPNLAAAQAALRQAKENLAAGEGNLFFPAVDAAGSVQRQSLSVNNPATAGLIQPIYNVYNVGVNVSYTLDVFGGNRRQLEALAAQVDYQRFQLEATYLTLTTNIVTTAITAASYQAQIEATQKIIQEQQEQLTISQKQLHLGGISGTDLLTQQSQLAQVKASLPPLMKSFEQTRHALAVLIGSYPSDADLPKVELNDLLLPQRLPVTLPSTLVKQRPDVRASEALYHQASANVGVATANLFPQFPLSANYGWSAGTPSGLFHPNSLLWAMAAQVTQPLFHGGALQAQRKAAIAAYDQAAAQYRQTVLQAFQNVADTLLAIKDDALTLQAQSQAEFAARDTLNITRKQLRLGGVSYLNVLTAEKQYQQAKLARIQAQAARYTDTAALFQALGGGWWNRTENIEQAKKVEGKKK